MTDKQTDYAALLKRSLVAIDELEAQLAAAQRARSEPIAIIGMACRFPGRADSPEDFWQLLENGIDAVTEVPKARWDIEPIFDPDPDAIGKTYARWGAFLDDVDLFDADLFGVSPREAVSLDPQHRILLEVTWEALERAGIPHASLMGSPTAVYVGITTHDYSFHVAEAIGFAAGGPYRASGTAHSMASGRIAYAFGLHGPNAAIDTACSSSHVAVHFAVRSLRDGEASLALAAGVNLTLVPFGSILTARARMMSPTGRCKTFDSSADGYVRGEGCGVLVLKRLSDAERDGDQVLAVIRGSALNQDGRSSGLTAPNGQAQEAVLRAALENAGLRPEDISYVEAHGTGTSLGDPIEVKALGTVFGARERDNPLYLGSVKTNIGHTEAAAGMAGIIKTVLALQHRAIPPHLHLKQPNPLIPWHELPVRIPVELTPWETPEGELRRAGISSFGFSGTNGHIILEEAPPRPVAAESVNGRPQLIVLSGQTPQALKQLAERVAGYLGSPDALPVAEVARTLARGRSHLAERLALVAADATSARERLAAFAAGDVTGVSRARASTGISPEIVFLFTGQGAQYPGMAMQLYTAEPVFRAALDECARLLEPHLPVSLLQVIAGEGECAALLDDTAYTQPALFAVEYSLARLWRSWGVEPTTVVGHSVGEYVAACLAGVFSLEDGLKLIAARGRLMSTLPRDGAMVAVFSDEAAVRAAIAGSEHAVDIAAVNGPTNTVISGASGAVDEALARLAAGGIEFQRLTVSHAFHSPLMEPILDEFEGIVASVPLSPPQIGLMSNLTGRLADVEITRPSYWRAHLREAVRFGDSIGALLREGYRLFLEVGPAPTLTGMARRCPGAEAAVWVASLRPGRNDQTSMLEGLGQLHVRGYRVDWNAVCGGSRPARPMALPTYPFQRQRFWQECERAQDAARLAPLRFPHPLLGGAVDSPIYIFQGELGVDVQPWLADHCILDLTIFPAAGFLELVAAAAREVCGSLDGELQDLVIREALVLPDAGSVTLQVIVSPAGDGRYAMQVCSRTSALGDDAAPRWRQHIAATLVVSDRSAEQASCTPPVFPADAEDFDASLYYMRLAAQGAVYGPAFRGIKEIRISGNDLLGELHVPESLVCDAAGQLLHPALLDAAFQLAGVLLPGARDESADADRYLPVGVQSYRIVRSGARAARCHVSVEPFTEGADTLRAHITLFDEHGAAIARVAGLEYRRATRAALERSIRGARDAAKALGEDWLFEVVWRAMPLQADASAPPDGRWLILADRAGLGAQLGGLLRARGAAVTLLYQSNGDSGIDGYHVDPTDPAALGQALAANAASDPRPLVGVVSLWALDFQAVDGIGAIEDAHRRLLTGTLNLVQGLADTPARLWLVTRGAQPAGECVPSLAQAPLVGLGNVIAAEHPELACVRIDLDVRSRPDEPERLFETIWQADAEDRIALRDDARLVPRLVHGPQDAPSAEPRVLEIAERGQLDRLTLRPLARRPPGPGEVELAVHATGLNFRDVLNALGMYPGDPGELGNECTGVVTAVGDDVEHLRVGDEVVAMVDRSFATHVIAPAALTVRKPHELSFAEAATVPVTFLTADYALRTLGRMRRGERVLIHAATGGVGMAAVQLARAAGAVIIGTAGSPAKRELARSLGVQHVADSRSLDFEQEVLRATNGEGVDIVLNSLAGDFIPASLRLLRQGGRFIEIGKTDIWNEAEVKRRFPGVEYHALYLGEVAAARPDLIRGMLEDILAKCVAGELRPLPLRAYPIDRAQDAFRFMAQGLHTGKVVIVQRRPFEVSPNCTYLITGGLGGLGLACARWLAERGARHLVLVSRRPPSKETRTQLGELETGGVEVRVAQADVADREGLANVLAAVRATMPPLRGVLHAAGAVDDGMLSEQSWSRFADVMTPKVRGTWNLHDLTRTAPLDFFAMFSSGAALLGSPGQSNYAAANAFLDSMAYVRRFDGRPAHSINWGVWAAVGMAARVGEQHQRRWADLGLRTIEPQTGVRMLERVLEASPSPQVAALPIVRSKLPRVEAGLLAELAVTPRGDDAKEDSSNRAIDAVPDLHALQGEARSAALVDFLARQVIRVLALDSGYQIDPNRSVMDMGIDSLMAMELRNRLQSALKVQVAANELLAGPTLAELAETLCARLPEVDAAEESIGQIATDGGFGLDVGEERQWVEL